MTSRKGLLCLFALAVACSDNGPTASIDRRTPELSGTIYGANIDAGVQFVYDPVGRLVGVITPSGDIAQYVYDPAGNITAIKRADAGVVSVIGFSQGNVSAGQSLTIYGSGFSSTAANDTVTINGVTATVTSASEGELVVSRHLRIELVAVVGLVADQILRLLFDEATVEETFDELGLMPLTTRNPAGDRKTVAVCHCHDLGRLAASSDPNQSAPLFAPAWEPST